ncbi:Rhodanese/Cell cycle control phosphatase superfamily protein [Euphorbia peplus]|nr:Rhodanese/Cell cycle control phosphatase superfamily protein [Euphorbia peplus]
MVAYRKWLNIVGRNVTKIYSTNTVSNSSVFTHRSYSTAFLHSRLDNRKLFLLPWKWSTSVNHQTFRFCTKTDQIRENKLDSHQNILKSVCVREAHQLHQAGHTYLDVRTPQEFKSGHPIGAINIPYMYQLGSEMRKNPKFLEEVSSHFVKCDKIIVGCRSGKRSLMAAADLFAAGYNGVTDVGGGYEAWTQNGLPTQN